MGKTIAIASYTKRAVSIYKEQIQTIYGDTLEFETISRENLSDHRPIHADVLLTPSYDCFLSVQEHLAGQPKVLFINRTISREGNEKIKALPVGEQIYLLDETFEMAKQMVSVLIQLGHTHVDWIPVDRKGIVELYEETVVVLGGGVPEDSRGNGIVDVGNSLIDVSTIVDISHLLDLDYKTRPVNLKTIYKEYVSADFGLGNIIRTSNSMDGQMGLLFEAVDFGAVVLDSTGVVVTCNSSAWDILSRGGQDLTGVDGIKWFPQLPIQQILEGETIVEEELIRIGGYDIVVSVDPIMHSEKFYGAIVILKRFSESEKKQHKIRAQLLGKGHQAKYRFEDIEGKSAVMIKCKEIAGRMSSSDSSVLISGESGTGKELFAQAIHNQSKRYKYQFVAVNCGAFPESLLESELFGYEEGAFTGARKGGKPGLFELAHKGTLFLDEIGEMPLRIQTRLLRVLQEREVMRVGGDTVINVDIRIIAATNKNLKNMVDEGKFREDLYYRINVLPLKIPPLRERGEDIVLLAKRFEKEMKVTLDYSDEVTELLIHHQWKGNVRELRNYVEYLVNLGLKKIDIEDLPDELRQGRSDRSVSLPDDGVDPLEALSRDRREYVFLLEQLEASFQSGVRAGRRSLSSKAKENGLFIGEQEVRGMLLELEGQGLVKIGKGRGGTIITEVGRRLL